jgi:isocitrate dehydrogenase kinase/phosphatase
MDRRSAHLAVTNIFAGDLLPKNFGVTRHNRVIFYDYDELCLVTDCRFREIPSSEHDEDELRAEAWYYVADNDVFPETFMQFLGFDEHLRNVFLQVHGEILTAAWWRASSIGCEMESCSRCCPTTGTASASSAASKLARS